MADTNPLAWYRWPEPDGTTYFEADLRDPEKVREIFDYYQILLASIDRQGWQYLLKTYGFDGLLEINRGSGWFDESDDGEAIQSIREHCLVAGYGPDRDRFGEYHPETGVFSPWDA